MLHSSVDLMDEGSSPLKAGGINWSNVEGKVRGDGKILLSSVGTYGTFNVRETIDAQPFKDFSVFKVGASLNQRINIQRFLEMPVESKKAFLRFDNKLPLEEIDELLEEIKEIEGRSAFAAIVTTEPVYNQELAHIYSSTGLPIYIGE